MDVSKVPLDLCKLTAVLEKTLEVTNITKNSICMSCRDVRNLLKYWCLPDVMEIEPPTCTCFQMQVNNEMNVEEIAKDIKDVVGNAQKLREGLLSKKINILKPRPMSSEGKLSNSSPKNKLDISPKNSKLGNHLPQQSSRPRPSKILKSQSNGSPRSTKSRSSSHIGTELERITRPTSHLSKATKTMSTTGRPSSGSRSCSSSNRSNASSQSTYQKDYRSSTSPSFSNKSSRTKVAGGLKKASSSTSSENEKSISTITMAQLDDLLNRVSIDGRPVAHQSDSLTNMPSTHLSQDCYEKQLNNDCLIHGKAIALKSKTSQVDFPEAIERLGVPSELVKVLRPYHSFLNKLHHQESQISKEKKAANQFLNRINLMNQTCWSDAMCEPSVSLFSEYTALFKELTKILKLSKNYVIKCLEKMDDLEKSYRKCSSHDASFLPEKATLHSNNVALDEKNKLHDWALAGIWNELTINGFKVMDETLCIRYNNVHQLTSFQETIRQTQRLQYQNEVLELLRADILPHLANLSPNDPAFVSLFKTVATLCDLKNLTLPILVKSSQTEK